MIGTVIKLIFKIYQSIFASGFATCRFTPTCSEYALEACQKYGPVKGLWLLLRRILVCHPFSKRPFYDPA